MPCLSVATSLAMVDSTQVGAFRLVWRSFVLRDAINIYADQCCFTTRAAFEALFLGRDDGHRSLDNAYFYCP